jgi:SAM-dependent methyltransferase
MLSRARLPPPFRAVVGDMLRLPLRSASFDLVTANFALSHVADHQAALGEVLRVLDRPGTLLASSWVPSRDPVVEAWGELVDRVLGAGGAERAMKEVSPLEAFYGVRENLEQSFSSAGFRAVRIEETSLSSEHTVEQYVTERSLNAAGRLARQTLGEAGWPEFASKAQVELRRRLGGRIAFSRSVLLAAATVG